MGNWESQIKEFKVEWMIQPELFNPFRVGFLFRTDYYTPILLGVMNIKPEGFYPDIFSTSNSKGV